MKAYRYTIFGPEGRKAIVLADTMADALLQLPNSPLQLKMTWRIEVDCLGEVEE